MGFVVDHGSDRGPANRPAALLVPPLAVLFIASLLVSQVFFINVAVQGDSMEPALSHADRVLVTRGYRGPRRGDIVSIEPVRKGAVGIIKRVIGLPGDVVSLDDERAKVNGVPEGPWVVQSREELSGWERRWTVPEDSLFVLGDNKPISQDSRYFGFVRIEEIQGRAVLRYWPPSRVARLDRRAPAD